MQGDALRKEAEMRDSRFVKIGTAYRAELRDGATMWVRKVDGTWSILWHFRNPAGEMQWGRLGQHRTKTAAFEDASILLNL